MRYIVLCVMALIALQACNTDGQVDFRDAFTGSYVTTSYTTAAYPIPPNQYFDTVVYNHDTVIVQVQKSITDDSSLVIMDDTMRLLELGTSTRFVKYIAPHQDHYAFFFNDTLRLLHLTGGSVASSYSTVWVGRKE